MSRTADWWFIALVAVAVGGAVYVGADLLPRLTVNVESDDERLERHERKIAECEKNVAAELELTDIQVAAHGDEIKMLWHQSRHVHMPDGGCIGAGCNGHCLIHEHSDPACAESP